jgi:hypothetical protein
MAASRLVRSALAKRSLAMGLRLAFDVVVLVRSLWSRVYGLADPEL